MSVIRVCFLGTPDFAVTHLQALIKDTHYEVVGVVTQPDRPSGRKMILTPSPVKKLAESFHIPILTPENLRKEPEILEIIQSWKAEVAVVVAFGQILDQKFLDSFTYGAVNVHGSLLPLWRGAAPIQRSIQAGDQGVGVCLQKMVLKLDAGAIIGERRLAIDNKINATELYSKLAQLGAELLQIELMDYIRGHLVPIDQDENQITVAKKILKEESLIDFSKTAQFIHNTVRAFSTGPGCYLFFQNKRLKIIETFYTNQNSSFKIGQVSQISVDAIFVQTGLGQLQLLIVQPDSKSKMPVKDFLKTVHLKVGDQFV